MDKHEQQQLKNEFGQNYTNWVNEGNLGGSSNWLQEISYEDARNQLGGYGKMDVGLGIGLDDLKKIGSDTVRTVGGLGGTITGGLTDGAIRSFANQLGIKGKRTQDDNDKVASQMNKYDLEKSGNEAVDRAFSNAKRKTATLGGYDKTGKFLTDENGEKILDKDGNPIEITENLRNRIQAEKLAQEENDNQVRSLYQAHKKGLISGDEFAGALMNVFGGLVGEIGNSVKGAAGLQGDFVGKDNSQIENLISKRLADSEARRAELLQKSQQRYLDNLQGDRETKKRFEEKLVDWSTDPSMSGALQKYNSEKKFGNLYKLIDEAEKAFGTLSVDDYRNLLLMGHLVENDTDISNLLGMVQGAGRNVQEGIKAVGSAINPLSLFKRWLDE